MSERLDALTILLQTLPGAEKPKSLSSRLANPELTAFTKELVYGVCRWYQSLNYIVKPLLKKPLKKKDNDIQITILLGAYQLLCTQKPEYAIVANTVDLAKQRNKKWATGFINAILREIIRNKAELSLKAKSAFPSWIKQPLKHAWPEHLTNIMEASLTPAPMTLRVNLQYTSRDAYLDVLQQQGIDAKACPNTKSAITLTQAIGVEELPDFFKGICSVQDEAAQWAAPLLLENELLNNSSLEKTPMHILDACCAPGGKTTHLLECLPNALVTALDISADRLVRVEQNLKRLNQTATCKAGDGCNLDEWWNKTLFDAVLLDAPCSGSGVIRRHPDIFWLKSEQDIVRLSILQNELLHAAWQTLKPGGILLYCTCSIFPEENSLQIQRFCEETPNCTHINLSSSLTIGEAQPFGIQLFPCQQGHDGFFYAKLRKDSFCS